MNKKLIAVMLINPYSFLAMWLNIKSTPINVGENGNPTNAKQDNKNQKPYFG